MSICIFIFLFQQIFLMYQFINNYILFSNLAMDIEKPLQQTCHQEPLISGNFYLNDKPTSLNIYSQYFSFSNMDGVYTIDYNPDTLFDIENDFQKSKIILETPEILQFVVVSLSWERQQILWEQTLIKIIKRRRFHQFFKGIRRIGKGNFASVYLSQKNSNKKLYAVKAFQKASTYKTHLGKEGLDNQISILRKLNQLNIPYLQGVYESQNSIYMVQEYIHGKNLGQILEERKFIPYQIRKKIMKDLLSAVAEMQLKHIIHRDIKPDNIMIQNGGSAKLVDFGLATDVRQPQYLYVRCGTPGYVAPEIISIRDCQNARLQTISDVFSVGAVFYQMIFGKHLFDGESNSQVLNKNRRCMITYPTSSFDGAPQELILLKRMLDVFPQTRITAIQALRSPYFTMKPLRQPLKQIKIPNNLNNKEIKMKIPQFQNNQN